MSYELTLGELFEGIQEHCHDSWIGAHDATLDGINIRKREYTGSTRWDVELKTTRGAITPGIKVLDDGRVLLYGCSSNYSGQMQRWARFMGAFVLLICSKEFVSLIGERNT